MFEPLFYLRFKEIYFWGWISTAACCVGNISMWMIIICLISNSILHLTLYQFKMYLYQENQNIIVPCLINILRNYIYSSTWFKMLRIYLNDLFDTLGNFNGIWNVIFLLAWHLPCKQVSWSKNKVEC